VRFSNANTTTDRYRFGARPPLPHTDLDVAGVVAGDASFSMLEVGTEARAIEPGEAPQPAANIPTSARIVAHRRVETTRASRPSNVTSPAWLIGAARCRRPGQ
jgi:hypothetical protein